VDLVLEVPVSEPGEPFGSRIKDPDREVTQPLGGIGGLHQVVSELKFFICRLQVKEKEKRRRQRTQSCTLCVTSSQHNAAKEMRRGTFSQPCCREGDARASRQIGNNGSNTEKRT
jgi:hypothetical protein